ncbi:AraC family transcriptional regulator [Niabella sp. 22666]|uniref:AraC family transcriptional regulator n=1 Tax=Niabella sp. 22666 TaxID=3453954 RepID=UPI003F84641D
MKIATEIRNLYKPIQPAVKQSDENVRYTEFLPHISLQPFIYCYWQLNTIKPLFSPYNYRVVADGCIDIVFSLDNPEESYVMGFCNKYNEFPLVGSFNKMGIRFLPTMFPQLFRVNALEVSNRLVELQLIIPYISRFIANSFNEKQRIDEVAGMLDSYFIQLFSKATFNGDNRLYEAIDRILKHCGTLDVQNGLNTGISARQLRRLFEFYVGDTAKTFSKVVRFQNFLNAKPSGQSLRQNKLFFDAGYYDQSHFIKEFKSLYGDTPGRAFDKG